MSDRYVVIDTEGTGLFQFSGPADGPGQPRLCSISMLTLDADLAVADEFSALIKPDGWVFDDNSDAAKVNGLTSARLNAEGIPVGEALDRYTEAVRAGYVMVAYNAQHDLKQMRAELRRAARDDLFTITKNVCVMRPCTDICQIPNVNRGGFKFPKLAEALEYFGIKQEGAHTSRGDAFGARAILGKLLALGACPEPGVHLAKKGTDAGKAKAARTVSAGSGIGRVSRPRSVAVSAGDEIPS